jgi:hypothetical protein
MGSLYVTYGIRAGSEQLQIRTRTGSTFTQRQSRTRSLSTTTVSVRQQRDTSCSYPTVYDKTTQSGTFTATGTCDNYLGQSSQTCSWSGVGLEFYDDATCGGVLNEGNTVPTGTCTSGAVTFRCIFVGGGFYELRRYTCSCSSTCNWTFAGTSNCTGSGCTDTTNICTSKTECTITGGTCTFSGGTTTSGVSSCSSSETCTQSTQTKITCSAPYTSSTCQCSSPSSWFDSPFCSTSNPICGTIVECRNVDVQVCDTSASWSSWTADSTCTQQFGSGACSSELTKECRDALICVWSDWTAWSDTDDCNPSSPSCSNGAIETQCQTV